MCRLLKFWNTEKRRFTVCELCLERQKNDVHFLSRDRKGVCTPFLSLVRKKPGTLKESTQKERGFRFPLSLCILSPKTTQGELFVPLGFPQRYASWGQGAKFSLICRAVGIKIRGFGGISDEATAEARSPRASFFSGVPGFFLCLKKEMGYISPLLCRIAQGI